MHTFRTVHDSISYRNQYCCSLNIFSYGNYICPFIQMYSILYYSMLLTILSHISYRDFVYLCLFLHYSVPMVVHSNLSLRDRDYTEEKGKVWSWLTAKISEVPPGMLDGSPSIKGPKGEAVRQLAGGRHLMQVH